MIAAVMAAVVLVGRGQPLVPRADRRAIASVAGTVVIGFPVLTAIALTHVPAIHAAIVVGLAPAATAGFAVLLSNERPTARYWIALSVGLVAVLVFAAAQGAGLPQPADLIVLLAAVLVGFGYAHGGALAKRYGGGTVICWALIIAVVDSTADRGRTADPPSPAHRSGISDRTRVRVVDQHVHRVLRVVSGAGTWWHRVRGPAAVGPAAADLALGLVAAR